MSETMIYVDNAATSELHPLVLEEMLPYLKEFYGNPSSLHSIGRKSKKAVETARMKVASYFGRKMSHIYFTSGGTESDNLALASAIKIGKKEGKKHIITSSIEHEGILSALKHWEGQGIQVTYIDPDKNGNISPSSIEKEIRPETCLISIMTINNELGSIQEVREIQDLARKHGVLFHTDAVQAIHYLPDQFFYEFDMISISAHKFYGPKGVGALITGPSISLQPILFGGGQERGIRSGTENVAAIVGMAKALEINRETKEEEKQKVKELKDYFLNKIREEKGIELTVDQNMVSDHFIHLLIEGIHKDVLLYQLDKKGICASSGSACSAGATEESHVLKAIGLLEKDKAPLRMTINGKNSFEEMDYIANSLIEIRNRRLK